MNWPVRWLPSVDKEGMDKEDMDKEDQAGAGKVGYKHPPEHTRFQPGQSGNPRGRPKNKAELRDIIDKVFNETVVVTIKGRKKRVSTMEAVVRQTVAKAAGGDSKARADVIKLAQAQPPSSGSRLDELVQEMRANSAKIESNWHEKAPSSTDEVQ